MEKEKENIFIKINNSLKKHAQLLQEIKVFIKVLLSYLSLNG